MFLIFMGQVSCQYPHPHHHLWSRQIQAQANFLQQTNRQQCLRCLCQTFLVIIFITSHSFLVVQYRNRYSHCRIRSVTVKHLYLLCLHLHHLLRHPRFHSQCQFQVIRQINCQILLRHHHLLPLTFASIDFAFDRMVILIDRLFPFSDNFLSLSLSRPSLTFLFFDLEFFFCSVLHYHLYFVSSTFKSSLGNT